MSDVKAYYSEQDILKAIIEYESQPFLRSENKRGKPLLILN